MRTVWTKAQVAQRRRYVWQPPYTGCYLSAPAGCQGLVFWVYLGSADSVALMEANPPRFFPGSVAPGGPVFFPLKGKFGTRVADIFPLFCRCNQRCRSSATNEDVSAEVYLVESRIVPLIVDVWGKSAQLSPSIGWRAFRPRL